MNHKNIIRFFLVGLIFLGTNSDLISSTKQSNQTEQSAEWKLKKNSQLTENDKLEIKKIMSDFQKTIDENRANAAEKLFIKQKRKAARIVIDLIILNYSFVNKIEKEYGAGAWKKFRKIKVDDCSVYAEAMRYDWGALIIKEEANYISVLSKKYNGFPFFKMRKIKNKWYLDMYSEEDLSSTYRLWYRMIAASFKYIDKKRYTLAQLKEKYMNYEDPVLKEK